MKVKPFQFLKKRLVFHLALQNHTKEFPENWSMKRRGPPPTGGDTQVQLAEESMACDAGDFQEPALLYTRLPAGSVDFSVNDQNDRDI